MVPSSGSGRVVRCLDRRWEARYMSPEQASGEPGHLGRAVTSQPGSDSLLFADGPAAIEGDDVGLGASEGAAGRILTAVGASTHRSIVRSRLVVFEGDGARVGEGRYATPKELSDDVSGAGDEPVTVWREPFTRRARRWASRNRSLVTAAAGAVLVRGRLTAAWRCNCGQTSIASIKHRPGDRQWQGTAATRLAATSRIEGSTCVSHRAVPTQTVQLTDLR